MNWDSLLTRIVDDGISAAKLDYDRPSQKEKRHGSIAGFEACRGKTAAELRLLLESSRIASRHARLEDRAKYWWFRCYEAEVEWVCNVVSAALVNEGCTPIVAPTARGTMKAAEILGVRRL